MAVVVQSNALRKGMIFASDGGSYLVLAYSHMKKGRGMATIRIKAKNVETGAIAEKTFSSSERVELADAQRKDSQYLYSDGTKAYFMDNNDYSQFEFSVSDIEWEMNFLREGSRAIILFIGEKPVTIEIAKSVNLNVIETSDAVKGDTSSNATKEAVLETGFKIQVPIFTKKGDLIKVNTETGTYTSRGESE